MTVFRSGLHAAAELKKKMRETEKKNINEKCKHSYHCTSPPCGLGIISGSKIGRGGQGNLRTQYEVGAATPQTLWSPL